MTKPFWTLLLALILTSCEQHRDKTDSDTTKEGNKLTTISTDTAKLSEIINIATYKPTHAKFKYTFIDNSGQNERLSVPGPSDSYLEVALYFDSITYKQIQAKYDRSGLLALKKEKGKYLASECLDTDSREALRNSDADYAEYPDYFFGLGIKGKVYLLKNIVLLTKSTD